MTSSPRQANWSDVHTAVWLVPAGALLLAVLPLPYGFYTFLRLVVFGGAGFLAYREWTVSGAVSVWMAAFVVLALLFNPLIPVHLNREAWAPIDVGTAILMVVHWRLVRRGAERTPS